MANIKQDNINFNVNKDAIFASGGKYTHTSNIDGGVDGSVFDADYFAENPNDITKSINAVEIDWNGAQLGDKEINTTGELLSH